MRTVGGSQEVDVRLVPGENYQVASYLMYSLGMSRLRGPVRSEEKTVPWERDDCQNADQRWSDSGLTRFDLGQAPSSTIQSPPSITAKARS